MPHENFMQRCLQLAEKGRGMVAPNPMVGCVITHNGVIIGEGWHRKYGEAHAEVNAVDSVQNPELLPGSTVYVSLEPCSHFGKTPPCANLLVKHKVGKVVIGCRDSNEAVLGKGIEILKVAGIEVEVGVLEQECRKQNERFFTFHEKKRPYIILKWAETKDGFIAGGDKQISGNVAQTLLHQWRAEEPAFMIGTKTLLEDNPRMNVRLWRGVDPVRIGVDMELRSEMFNKTNPLHFYDGSQRTILINGVKNESFGNFEFVKIDNNSTGSIVDALFMKKIQSVVIEGGAAFLQSFINDGCYDEIRIFKSKVLVFGKGLNAPVFSAQEITSNDLDTDRLIIYKPF